MAARLKRKHEWAITTILPEENRPVRLYPVGTGQSCTALKSTPEKNLGLSDSREQTSSNCCVHPLRPPRLPAKWILGCTVTCPPDASSDAPRLLTTNPRLRAPDYSRCGH